MPEFPPKQSPSRSLEQEVERLRQRVQKAEERHRLADNETRQDRDRIRDQVIRLERRIGELTGQAQAVERQANFQLAKLEQAERRQQEKNAQFANQLRDVPPRNPWGAATEGHIHRRTMIVDDELDPNTANVDGTGYLAEEGTQYWSTVGDSLWVNIDGWRNWIPIGGKDSGSGPWDFDYLVDANWATVVATGAVAEGDDYTTFHGFTFYVYSTIQAALTHASTRSDIHTISVRILGGTYVEDITLPAWSGSTSRGWLISGVSRRDTIITGNMTNATNNTTNFYCELENLTNNGTLTHNTGAVADRFRLRNAEITGTVTFSGNASDHLYEDVTLGNSISMAANNSDIAFHNVSLASDFTCTGNLTRCSFTGPKSNIGGSVNIEQVNTVTFDTRFGGSGVPGYHVQVTGSGNSGLTLRGYMESLSGASAAKNYIILTPGATAMKDTVIDVICEIPTSTANEVHYLKQTGANSVRGLHARIQCGVNATTGDILEDMAGGYAAVKGVFLDSTFLLTPCRSTVDLTGSVDGSNCIISGNDSAGLGDDGLADHIADTSDAHDASAISILDTANDFTATDVEGALAELQSDNEAHVAAADPHTGYLLESLLDAKGDIIAASADNTPAKVTVGANDTILMADSGQTTGLKWQAPATTSEIADTADTESAGTSDTWARGDHVHKVHSQTASLILTAPGADLPLTTPCAALTQAESTTNDVNYEYLAFDSATDEYCYWPPIPLPDGITGTTFSVVPYWTASSGTGTVAWTFQMQVRANDGAIDQAWGTAAASTDTLLATGDWHIGPAVTVTPSGTITGGDILLVRMFRDVSEDTLNADAWFLAAKVEFTRSYSD